MNIKQRQRCIARDGQTGPRNAFRQRKKGARTLDEHTHPELRNGRHVAQKLNGISKAPVCPEKEGFPANCRRPVPQWLLELAGLLRIIPLIPRELSPAALEIVKCVSGEPQANVSGTVLRSLRIRCIEAVHGLLRTIKTKL